RGGGPGAGRGDGEDVGVVRELPDRVAPASVGGVAGDRVPEAREVNPDLVPPPGLEPHLDERMASAGADDAPVRDGDASASGITRRTDAPGLAVDEPGDDPPRRPPGAA